MAIQDVIRMGHSTLLKRAEEVSDPKNPEIQALLEDMYDTLEEQQGVGLAAPQINVSKRVVIFYVPSDRQETYEDADEEVPMTVLINPVIEPIGDEIEESFEACLSVPGMSGLVARWANIRYSGLDKDGKPFEREAKGFHARVVQHECDHLDGVLYPMRVEDIRDFGFSEELRDSFMEEDEA